MSNPRTISSIYILDSNAQSSPNYIKALDRCLQHVLIRKVNVNECDPEKPFTWNDVKKLFGGTPLTIECAFNDIDSTVGILPTLGMNHFMTCKNQDPKKNLTEQATRIRDYINGIHQKNPRILYSIPNVRINNKDEALYVASHLLKQFKLADITGIVCFEQHQLILLQIYHNNYYLHYGEQSKFGCLMPITFDLDDGFTLETKNSSHGLNQFINIAQENSQFYKNYQSIENNFNNWVDEYLNAIRDQTLRVHNLNIEYFFSYILTKMPEYKDNFPLAQKHPIGYFFNKFEKKVDFQLLKDFIKKEKLTYSYIFINIDCKNMEQYFQQYSEYATELKILFELQKSFYQWKKNNYAHEMIPISESGIPYLQKPLFACQVTLFPMNFQTHEFNSKAENSEDNTPERLGII